MYAKELWNGEIYEHEKKQTSVNVTIYLFKFFWNDNLRKFTVDAAMFHERGRRSFLS